MRARYYNPQICRFVSQDVLFGDLNPGISLNRFAFANGNPVSLIDPFGLCAVDGGWLQQVTNTVNYLINQTGTFGVLNGNVIPK
jgi:hypothetical protein